MHDPELYEENNDFQKRDAIRCLKKYGNKIHLKSEAHIIDLGSGSGFVTSVVLQKFIRDDFKSIVGIDISEEMLEYSNKHYGNERISFAFMDIGGDLLAGFKGHFHLAVSFYALHWVYDQEKAFKNIYDLLTQGGECLVMFMCHSPIYDMFRILSRTERWNPWMGRSVDVFVTRYHDLLDPVKELQRIMTKVGFKNVFVENNHSPYEYNNLDSLKTFVQALNPFNIPQDLLEEFGEDAVQALLDLGAVVRGDNTSVSIDNTQLIAHGLKC